ncbi:MAG: DUF58 domain-containing protein [Myxococcota bacterium]
MSVWTQRWHLLPLTWAGVWTILLATTGLMGIGVLRQDRFVALLTGAALVTVVLALVMVFVGAWRLHVTLRAAAGGRHMNLVSGMWSETGLVLPRLWIPLVDIRTRWLDVSVETDGRWEDGQWHERVRAGRRGHRVTVQRWVEVRDVFGLAQLAWVSEADSSVTVRPFAGALEQVAVLAGLQGGPDRPHPEGEPEGDLLDLRAYGPGDPIRHVVWKAYAKHRVLLVRKPERALSEDKRTLAWLVVDEADEAAAGAMSAVLTQGLLGRGGAMGADGVAQRGTDIATGAEVLIESGDVPLDDSLGAGGAGAFLSEQSREGSTHLMIFAPPRVGPWMQRVGALVAQGCRVDVLICFDSMADTERERVVADTAAVHQVAGDLMPMGVGVWLVDRSTGDMSPVGEHHLARGVA